MENLNHNMEENQLMTIVAYILFLEEEWDSLFQLLNPVKKNLEL
jgi:hypothetical protein